jgi:Fur family ferric uptake transcriptional regulator
MQLTDRPAWVPHIRLRVFGGLPACPPDCRRRVPLVNPTSDMMRRVRDEARRRGVRWTTQRQVIVETFTASGEHITVEDLHHRVRAIDRTVSAATVYRTINMLVEMGVATKRHFGSGSASFECEVDKAHHDHLVCVSCGKIQEFHNDRIEELQVEVARGHGFALSHHRMELYGTCAECVLRGDSVKAPALP